MAAFINLLFINLDETSVGHTPIGCVAKPRTAGGKQPHAQVLKQHVRVAWTYVSVICNCKHIQGKLPHFLIGTQVKLTKKLLRAQRALPQTRLRFAAKVRLDLCCQQCPNSQRDRRSAQRFSVKTRRCTP